MITVTDGSDNPSCIMRRPSQSAVPFLSSSSSLSSSSPRNAGRSRWLRGSSQPARAVAHAVAGTCSSLLEMVRVGREWTRINVPVLLRSLLGAQDYPRSAPAGYYQDDQVKTCARQNITNFHIPYIHIVIFTFVVLRTAVIHYFYISQHVGKSPLMISTLDIRWIPCRSSRTRNELLLTSLMVKPAPRGQNSH